MPPAPRPTDHAAHIVIPTLGTIAFASALAFLLVVLVLGSARSATAQETNTGMPEGVEVGDGGVSSIVGKV